MGFDPNSKGARRRERQHQALRAKAFPTMDPMHGKLWAITDEQKQFIGNKGWGNENGSVRIIDPVDTQATPTSSGTGDTRGWIVGNTTWMDGIPTQCDETKVTKWVDPTPPKTDEELLRERVNKACSGWPWNGLPSKLVSVVSLYSYVLAFV